jgi:hypothetical protein
MKTFASIVATALFIFLGQYAYSVCVGDPWIAGYVGVVILLFFGVALFICGMIIGERQMDGLHRTYQNAQAKAGDLERRTGIKML